MISKKRNKKGFTLMEMLIVVAIIAILVAIMIPTFNAQLEKAREATDAANIRAAYAEVMVKYLDGTGADANGNFTEEVKLQQKVDDWANTELGTNLESLVEKKEDFTGTPSKGGTCTVTVSGTTGAVTIAFAAAQS